MFFVSSNFDELAKDKWLLWDTCALVRVVDCDADNLMAYLNKVVAENVTIKPVILELGATKDQKLAFKRMGYADRYISTILKTNLDIASDKTSEIQAQLPRNSQPGAVDLMLASTLAKYGVGDKVLLVTENIQDFPKPLFIKKGFFMVSNDMKSYGLTLLSINLDILI